MAANRGNDPKNDESSSAPDPVKPATKIKIIEDAEATGETAAAYDFWRAGSGRHQVPGIIKCFGALCLLPEPVSVLTGQPCLLPAGSGSD